MSDDAKQPAPADAPEWLRYCGPDWYGDQDDNGIDLSLIRENLTLTPEERIRRGEMAERETRELQEYGRRHWENKLSINR